MTWAFVGADDFLVVGSSLFVIDPSGACIVFGCLASPFSWFDKVARFYGSVNEWNGIVL